jgi:hypothetical protein
MARKWIIIIIQSGQIHGERHSKTMWMIIGLLTIKLPIGLSLCRGYISEKDNHNDDVEGASQSAKYTELRTAAHLLS